MDAFERRSEPTGLTWLVARALEDRGVLAAFTERTGGASGPPFDSLNLGFRVGDDPSVVRANREAVCAALGIPPFTVAEQVHGARVGEVSEAVPGEGDADHGSVVPGSDGLDVGGRGAAVAILTADCVPIALADDRRVVAVHAGWRGLAAGIVRAAAERFPDPSAVAAAIGPAIGPCHYEVRDDVLSVYDWGSFVRRAGARRFLDLPGVAADQLRGAGVREIAGGLPCTHCEAARFFSFRRDGRTGRQALVAMRR